MNAGLFQSSNSAICRIFLPRLPLWNNDGLYAAPDRKAWLNGQTAERVVEGRGTFSTIHVLNGVVRRVCGSDVLESDREDLGLIFFFDATFAGSGRRSLP